MLKSKLSAIAGVLALAGCSTTAPPPPEDNAIRNVGQTAPADLQLLCASEAAVQLGLDSDGVFPVSSVAAAGGYQVNLRTGNGQAVCNIDTAGNVITVQEV
jgi:hypothetical protein